MTDQEIQARMERLVRTERKITNEILKLVRLADERKFFLELGFSSLFDWMTRGLGYSEGAAQRRIGSARLVSAVPAAAEKIESGKLNLTTLAKAQAAIRAEEKVVGGKLSEERKAAVVSLIEDKSAAEAEKVLVDFFPDSAPRTARESRVEIAGDQVRLSVTLSREAVEDLERVRDLLSHALPEASLADVIAYVAREFRARKDPLSKKSNHRSVEPSAAALSTAEPSVVTPSTAAAAKRRVSAGLPAAIRKAVMERDQSRCVFEDPRTKRRCGSTYRVELDHVYPRALGGEDTVENLRCLCRSHNLHAARLTLGESRAGSWRRLRT